MSLERIRRSSRVVAAILLLTSMLQFPHPSLDDEACSPSAAERHDESKHVFTSVTPTSHPDHCAICHWTRWMNPAFSSGPSVIVGVNSRSELATLDAGVLRDRSTDLLPPRAPPVL
jgi:hypothetical protein